MVDRKAGAFSANQNTSSIHMIVSGLEVVVERTCKKLNLTLALLSLSAMAKYSMRFGWPTYDARLSLCWFTTHSLHTHTHTERERRRNDVTMSSDRGWEGDIQSKAVTIYKCGLANCNGIYAQPSRLRFN